MKSEAEAYRIMADALPEVFAAATEALLPSSWRLLHHAGQFPWSLAYDPCLDLRQHLRIIAGEWREVPQEWLGDVILANAAGDADLDIRTAEVDAARAIWLTLAFAKSLRLSEAEVLHLEWWRPAWLQQWINPPSHQQ